MQIELVVASQDFYVDNGFHCSYGSMTLRDTIAPTSPRSLLAPAAFGGASSSQCSDGFYGVGNLSSSLMDRCANGSYDANASNSFHGAHGPNGPDGARGS